MSDKTRQILSLISLLFPFQKNLHISIFSFKKTVVRREIQHRRAVMAKTKNRRPCSQTFRRLHLVNFMVILKAISLLKYLYFRFPRQFRVIPPLNFSFFLKNLWWFFRGSKSSSTNNLLWVFSSIVFVSLPIQLVKLSISVLLTFDFI